MLDAGRAPPRGELGPCPARIPNRRSMDCGVKSESSSLSTKPPLVTSLAPNMWFTELVMDTTSPCSSTTTVWLVPPSSIAKRSAGLVSVSEICARRACIRASEASAWASTLTKPGSPTDTTRSATAPRNVSASRCR